MRPRTLTLDNFLSYGPETTVDFTDSGAVAIVGENGSGKSSLVEAIGWALYGRGRGRGPDDFIHAGASSCRVRFEFELDEHVYAVERQRQSGSGGKSYLGLTTVGSEIRAMQSEDVLRTIWSPVGGDSIAETQAAIEDLLGMSAEVWESTSYIGQGKADAFTQLRPAERKRLLVDLLELGRYEELTVKAKNDEHAATAQLLSLEQRAATLRQVLETEAAVGEELVRLNDQQSELVKLRQVKAEEIQAARERVLRLEARETELLQVREELDALRSRRQSDAAELDRSAEQLSRDLAFAEKDWQSGTDRMAAAGRGGADLEDLQARHTRLEEELTSLTSQVEALAAPMQECNSRSSELLARLQLNEAASAETSARLDGLHETSGTCFTCGQVLTEGALEALVASLLSQSQGLERDAADMIERLSKESVRWEHLDREESQLSAAVERRRHELSQVEQRLPDARAAARYFADPAEHEALEAKSLRVIAAREELERFATRRLAVREPSARELELEKRLQSPRHPDDPRSTPLHVLETELTELEHRSQQTAVLQGQAEQKAAGIREGSEELEKVEHEAGRIAGVREEIRILIDAFGPNGIPTLIIETAVPELEAEANRLLGQLTDGRFTLRIESLKALKGGGVRESLEIVVGDETSERPLEALSGGERQCVDLSLRISLARLLAHRAGRQIETLVIDEGFTALDVAHRQRTISMLHGLLEEFPCVLFVTHLQDLAEAFPTQVQVSRENGSSTARIVDTGGNDSRAGDARA